MDTANDLMLPSHEFWIFSVDQYQLPGIKPHCLRLQDAYGMNINVFLLQMWFAKTGRGRILKTDLQDLLKKLSLWHDGLTDPLRSLRKTLAKPEVRASFPGIYEMVLCDELAAEQIEQTILLDSLPRMSRPNRGLWQRSDDLLASIKTYATLQRVRFTKGDKEGFESCFKHCFPELSIENIEQLCSGFIR